MDVPFGGLIKSPSSLIRGWISLEGDRPIERLWLANPAGRVVPLAFVDRPDVRQALPDRTSTGFSAWIDARTMANGPWSVGFRRAGEDAAAPVPLRVDTTITSEFSDAKARKLARIRPLLRCPKCGGKLTDDEQAIECANGHRFGVGTNAYDFLDDATRERVGAVPTSNVSAHGYDEVLRKLISETSGPILDAGAGLRPDYREEVVNLEIVAYPTTDVVAAVELLPFADDSFDLVISVAVLEHVRDPFAAARELERVVRPGGRIFAAVPFLQPYHGYPDHYYNMTSGGLRNLFRNCEVESLFVPRSGSPIFVLTWLLQSWRNALPPETLQTFDTLRVSDLAVDPLTLIDEPFVTQLPEHANVELAALNVLIGKKR
ncbi:MAG TPA: methyltransferase domain-containing protein [Candidatus Sulfotelmatobacter sp.]|nr:methyltransferase domain-containing protein [Candidatus Sulfotelmatobacter sp.]